MDVSTRGWEIARFAEGKYVLALTPRDGRAAGRYRLEVTALQDGKPGPTARLIAGYVIDAGERARTLSAPEQCGVFVAAACDHWRRCGLFARGEDHRACLSSRGRP